jgi:hypothetical protein
MIIYYHVKYLIYLVTLTRYEYSYWLYLTNDTNV